MCSHVGNLHEHGRDQVDTLQHLQVDVHVEWNLTLLLNLLLLTGTLMMTLEGKAQNQLGTPYDYLIVTKYYQNRKNCFKKVSIVECSH